MSNKAVRVSLTVSSYVPASQHFESYGLKIGTPFNAKPTVPIFVAANDDGSPKCDFQTYSLLEFLNQAIKRLDLN